jgi:hypothetical protein
MRRPIRTALLALSLVLPSGRISAQACFMVRDQEERAVASNPATSVEFLNGQFLRVHWSTGTKTIEIDVHPGFPTRMSVCPGSPLDGDLYFDAAPRRGVHYQWWITDAPKPIPQGGPQDPALRAYLMATLGLPQLKRVDRVLHPEHPDMITSYALLDVGTLTGDSLRLGTTVVVAGGKDTVLATMSWTLARPAATVAVAAPPRPSDPCTPEGQAAELAAAGPDLQSASPTGTTAAPARVEPPRQTSRQKLVTAFGCYPEAKLLLRAFYNGALTSGVSDPLAESLLPMVVPRGATAAAQHAQMLAIHERLLAGADASKVMRELFAERPPSGTPLAELEGEVLGGSFRAGTWTDALRRMDRHLVTGAADAPVEARTEATLFLLSRRGEWTGVRIVETLAAFAPPVVGTVVGAVAPLYADLPATRAGSKPIDEAAPEAVDYALAKSKQLLGFLDQLGAPGAKEVAQSAARIKSGVAIATGKATPLEVLQVALDALPQDDAIRIAKGQLGSLTRLYTRLAAVAGEPDRLIDEARFDAALAHFADRNASLPSITGWIGAAGDEVKRTTSVMVARRDTIATLRAEAEQRFGRPFERELEECTPNLECFSSFADYKVGIEQQQYHLAHLIDERAANIIEQRALCWRLAQRGGSTAACGASSSPRK